jgi:SAM-dependent methyltransferase
MTLRAGSRLEICRDVAGELAKNVAMGIPAVRRWRLRKPRAGAVFTGRQDELERYAFQSVRLLQAHVGSLAGLHVAEVGAGDYLTSGFSLLAAGAATYTVIDRFPGDYFGEQGRNWYRGIRSGWETAFPDIPWPADLDAGRFPDGYGSRLDLVALPIEQVTAERKFDVVCSFQVGEHVSSLPAFAAMTARLLAPGGIAVHRVDFGAHDCWTQYRDPLTFLRIPDWLWRATGSNRGTPNRLRYPAFVEAFAAAGLAVATHDIEHARIENVDVGRLPSRLRRIPIEELAVCSATFVLRATG